MTGKKFFLSSLILIIAVLAVLAGTVFVVDPFFHYRAPNPDLYYRLYDQRSQNDGITKHFYYDSIVTGTSMAENFKTSRFDDAMNTRSVKVCYSGATYKEINDNLKVAYESGHSVRYVLRPLDYSLLFRDKDVLREDMGDYPDYLTDRNPFNDVKYLLNRDVVINYTLPVLGHMVKGDAAGYTDFDEYSYTDNDNVYGREYVLMGITGFDAPQQEEVNPRAMATLQGNIEQNVVALARNHPETTFIYFFPPYSMAYWGSIRSEGALAAMLEGKKAAIEQMLECDNIHIYSFSFYTDITGNLDKYRDPAHYCAEVNDLLMDKMTQAEVSGEATYDRITKDNYKQYLEDEKELFENYDYNKLLAN